MLAIGVEIGCLTAQKRVDDVTLIYSNTAVLSPDFSTGDDCLWWKLLSLVGFSINGNCCPS